MNEKILENLINECKNMLKYKTVYLAKYYEEVLEKVINSNCSLDDKIELLTQLYRYGHYSNVQTAIDPRRDEHMKFDTLENIGSAADKGNIEEFINIILESNDKMRDSIDNPVLLISESIDFFNKNPGAKF